jgi:dihydroorotate dehydrogenase (NAD+) catalytic subunit
VTPSPLSVELFGRHFQNPLLLAAGTAGFGRELDEVIDLDRLGGIITKAVSLQPRAGNPAPRVAEFAGGMLNSVGLANPGVEWVRSEALPWLSHRLRRAQVLVNVVGFTVEEYGEVVARLNGSPAIAAFEINLSCPNTCRTRTSLPLIAKLSPVLPDIAGMAVAARDAGADAIAAVNTMPGLLYDQAGSTRLGQGSGGVSGPPLLPIGVLAVSRILERTGGIPVIGAGGIRTAGDVRQYLRAGASLVAVGTGALADPHLPERIIKDLERESG